MSRRSASTPNVALFDIDGTLISTGGAGARSWAHAFDRLYGVAADIGSHSEAGETDPVVARKTFEAALGRAPADDELARLFAAYLFRLSEEVSSSPGYHVLAGAHELLESLSEGGTMLGIVSGAMEGAARVKLGRADLNRFFLFGGYGSDSSDRTELTRVAIEKASMLHGHGVTGARVMVVGDTPRDMAAARSAGAVAVGVGFTVSWHVALAAGVAVFLVRMAEDYFVVPRVLGHAVGLSPLLVLVSVTAVGLLLGGVYVLLAIPIAAVGATLVDVLVLEKDPAQEDVPAVLFPAQDRETAGGR
jgi:phosphoglycolate phosphatase-like HAD superfamily hydrolase